MTSERGEKELRTDWPVVEGTTFSTTKTHDRDIKLQPVESKVLSRTKVLL